MPNIPQPKIVEIDADHFMQRVEAYPPLKFVSDDDGPNARMLVESDSTGLFVGRQFRAFVEFDIPAGDTIWVRHTIGQNFTLHDQRVSIISGAIRWSAVAGTSSGPGPWTPVTVRPRNQMTSRPLPLYPLTAVVEKSLVLGGVLGGFDVDVMRVSAAGTGNQSAGVQQNAGVRGLPPGIYHVKMTNTSNEASVGVYDWWWEERP